MPRDQTGVVRDSGGGGGGAGGGGGSGAPTDADYLVGTANGSLSAEIVVGTSPGGELGGTWASPTVDATHSGSSHAATQAAAESTAATNLASHEADTTNIHGITNTALLETTAGAQAKADAKVADAINDATTTVAPSQNVVFDALALKAPLASPTFTGSPAVPADAYDASSWNGSLGIPTKDAVRDKIEDILDGVTFTGLITATAMAVSGLTGATATPPRCIGGTASGPPVSGTFALGDYCYDATGAGYFCTVAGTPGTWVPMGSGIELAYAATTTDDVQVNAGTMDISGASVASFVVGSRPVYVIAQPPHVGVSVTAKTATYYITDAANTATRQAQFTGLTGALGIGGLTLHERINTPGTYTRKLRGAGQAACTTTFFGATTIGSIRVVTA